MISIPKISGFFSITLYSSILMSSPARILIVSAEFWPFAKTGGLGDMVYTIATSLRDRGYFVQVLLPGYRSVLSALSSNIPASITTLALKHDVGIELSQQNGLEFLVVRCDSLFDRPGGIYSRDDGTPWPDNAIRFGVLCKVAAAIADGATTIAPPDLVHLHDWHAALTPAYRASRRNIPVVLTVHNFMYQGRFSLHTIDQLELSKRQEILDAARLFDGFSFLQVGLALCNVVTTTSENYVSDIRQRTRHNWYYIRDQDLDRLHAITNWPDLDAWNPRSDSGIAARFSEQSLENRKVNKIALRERLGWPPGNSPILCTMSRITKAKGFKFLLKQVKSLLVKGCDLVVVGDGERRLINAFRNFSEAYPERVALITPYDEGAARQTLSGADFLLMPSLTEPCGLSQQHAQLFGCVPIASSAGGIPDTVRDGQSGFLFKPSDRGSFLSAIDRALEARSSPGWTDMQLHCMRRHYNRPDRTRYADLFNDLINAAPSNSLN